VPSVCKKVALWPPITAELGRALAVVKVTPSREWENANFGVLPPKNNWGDKDKIWHN